MSLTALLPVFFGNFKPWEVIVTVVAILLLFGAKRIPELMRNLGKGIHSFKKGVQEAKQEIEKPLNDDESLNDKAEHK